MFYGIRYNPLTNEFAPVSIVSEVNIAQELDELPGVYGFYLTEIPLRESPSSFVLFRNGSPTVLFTEISSGAPGSEEYYVDYHNTPISGLGRVFLEDSEDGEEFLSTYKGLGTALNNKNLIAYLSSLIDEIVTELNANIDAKIDFNPNWNSPSTTKATTVSKFNDRIRQYLSFFGAWIISFMSEAAGSGSPSGNLFWIVYNQTLDIFLASGAGAGLAYTPGGSGTLAWTYISDSTVNQFNGQLYSSRTSAFFIAINSNVPPYHYSSNGISWTSGTIPGGSGSYLIIAWQNPNTGHWYARTNTNHILDSSDGITWTDNGVGPALIDVGWDEDYSRFIAIDNTNYSANTFLKTSTDGINWSTVTTNLSGLSNAPTYVAIGQNKLIISSTGTNSADYALLNDLTTFTNIPVGQFGQIWPRRYLKELNTWIALTYDLGTNIGRYAFSHNGIDYTAIALTNIAVNFVQSSDRPAWDPQHGQLVVPKKTTGAGATKFYATTQPIGKGYL